MPESQSASSRIHPGAGAFSNCSWCLSLGGDFAVYLAGRRFHWPATKGIIDIRGVTAFFTSCHWLFLLYGRLILDLWPTCPVVGAGSIAQPTPVRRALVDRILRLPNERTATPRTVHIFLSLFVSVIRCGDTHGVSDFSENAHRYLPVCASARAACSSCHNRCSTLCLTRWQDGTAHAPRHRQNRSIECLLPPRCHEDSQV